MPGIQSTIRGLLKTAITNIAGPVIPTYSVTESYFPKAVLEALGEQPNFFLVSVGFNSDRERLLRDKSASVEVPVQVACMQRINPADTAYIDQLVELIEQAQIACEDDFSSGAGPTKKNYSWQRTEILRDEDGVAYSYEQLTRDNIFNAVFTPIYLHPNTRTL